MPRVFLPQILWHSKDNKRCDRIYSIDFQPKAKDDNTENNKNTTTLRLATGGADEFVHIWQITIHDHAPQYTHFVNNNQNSENKTEFEQPLSIRILARLVGHIGEVNSVRWSHDGRVLASGGEDRCIFLWVKGTKQNMLNEDGQNDYEEYWTRTHYFRLSNVVNSICWCPEDRVLSVSTEDGHISLVDTQVEGTGKIRYFDGHTNFAQGVCLDPKNELLASLGSDQCLRVWKRRNQKQWKSVLVLKAARDRGDLIPVSPNYILQHSKLNFIQVSELENNYELRKYSRYVFMSEELKTFFRRLDWSPDGRLLVAPTGIRYDKNNVEDPTTINNLDSTVYTLYIFHRKLINLGIPMITHQSPTGPFVVVKFCPIYFDLFDKKRKNFYNLLMNASKNQMKPIKKKQEKTEKQTTMTNKINTYFTSVNNTKETEKEIKEDNNMDNETKKKEEKDEYKEEMEEYMENTGEEAEYNLMMQIDEAGESENEESMVEEDVLTTLEENEEDNTPYMGNTTVTSETNEEEINNEETKREEYRLITTSSNTEQSEVINSYEDFESEFKEDTSTTLEYETSHSAENNEFQSETVREKKEEINVKDELEDKEEMNVKDELEDKEEMNVKEEVKEEQEERRYNLRKIRKSVIPLLLESEMMNVKKEKKKNKEKKEKVKKEEEPKEEDYDTDLEEELSIPRFLFAAGTTDGSLCFFDTKEKTGPIAVLKNLHFCPITDISWSTDGHICASSSSDGYITFVIFNKRELS